MNRWIFGCWLLWMVWIVGWPWWKSRREAALLVRAEAWPTRDARVISVQVNEKKRGRHGSLEWRGLLTYSYIEGEVRIGEYSHNFDIESEADAWADSLRERFIRVSVNPDNVNESRWLPASAKPVLQAAGATANLPAAAGLGPKMESVRLLMFWASCVGAVFSVWAQVGSLLGLVLVPKSLNLAAFAGMHLGAMACAAGTTLVFSKRYPGRPQRRALEQMADPSMRTFVQVLSGYGFCVFGLFWARAFFRSESNPSRGSVLMFSSIWLIFYVTSALTCWLAGKNQEPENELAPKR